MEKFSSAIHKAILMVDIEGFSDPCRNQVNHVRLRASLYEILREAFQDKWDECWWEGTGDGALVLIPPAIPKLWLVDDVINTIAALLCRHNDAHSRAEKMRLRAVLHAGEVIFDEIGATSPGIILAARLLDAEPIRETLAESSEVLAWITSAWFFDEVVRHSERTDPSRFRKVEVTAKETSTTAWVSLPARIGGTSLGPNAEMQHKATLWG